VGAKKIARVGKTASGLKLQGYVYLKQKIDEQKGTEHSVAARAANNGHHL
jgi:hypothetical protein